MPKIKARILTSELKDKKFISTIQCERKLPINEIVNIKWGTARSGQQNKFYWLYLNWVLEHGGLKDEYLTAEELHETLKGRFLAKKVESKLGFNTIVIGSTTELDKVAFGDYIDKIDKALTEYCGVNTAPFFEEYRDMYSQF